MSAPVDLIQSVLKRLRVIENTLIGYRRGVVTAITPNLQIALGGSSVSYTSVRAIGGQPLTVGAQVGVLMLGNDLIVLGRIGGSEVPQAYTFSNGWRAFGGGTAPWGNQGFYKDAGGIVHLEGLLDKNGGSWVAAEVILTLPVGYRPPSTRMFQPPVSPVALARIDVETTGIVRLVAGGASNPVGHLSLDGIVFQAAG